LHAPFFVLTRTTCRRNAGFTRLVCGTLGYSQRRSDGLVEEAPIFFDLQTFAGQFGQNAKKQKLRVEGPKIEIKEIQSAKRVFWLENSLVP